LTFSGLSASSADWMEKAVPYTMMTPRMEELLARVGSRFALVTLSGMRACEINDYYNQLGEGLGTIVPPQVMSLSRKPLSIAMEEIEVGKIEAVRLPTDEERAAEAQAGADSASLSVDDTAHAPAPREKHESLWKVRAASSSRTRTKQA
jgi:DNA-directed RNA polymerase subunit omega